MISRATAVELCNWSKSVSSTCQRFLWGNKVAHINWHWKISSVFQNICLWFSSKDADWQQREQVRFVPYQVEIRFLNSFNDVACPKLFGSEFHTLGPEYLIDCVSILDGVIRYSIIREWSLLWLCSDSLIVKGELTLGWGWARDALLCGSLLLGILVYLYVSLKFCLA